MRFATPFLLLPCLAACATDPKPTHERGWIGGEFADVVKGDVERFAPLRRERVVGVPDGVESGALLVATGRSTPLAKAGLAPGDLVLSADGAPVEDALALRERIEAMTPGSRTALAYWRAGETKTAEVVVGRETWESAGSLGFGLPIPLWGSFDLWPFDDGFDVFHLVGFRVHDERRELDTPQNAYRQSLRRDDPPASPEQESWELNLFPFRVTKGKRVLRQETLP